MFIQLPPQESMWFRTQPVVGKAPSCWLGLVCHLVFSITIPNNFVRSSGIFLSYFCRLWTWHSGLLYVLIIFLHYSQLKLCCKIPWYDWSLRKCLPTLVYCIELIIYLLVGVYICCRVLLRLRFVLIERSTDGPIMQRGHHSVPVALNKFSFNTVFTLGEHLANIYL